MAIASVDPNSRLADLAIPIGISDIIDADDRGVATHEVTINTAIGGRLRQGLHDRFKKMLMIKLNHRSLIMPNKGRKRC